MAQLLKYPTLDISSGHDLRVVRSNLVSGSQCELALNSLSPLPLPVSLLTHVQALSCSLALSNKILKKNQDW